MQKFAWGLLVLTACPATSEELPQGLKITVRVFAQTAVSRQLLEGAETEATYTTQNCGFAIEWINCLEERDPCSAELRPNEFVVLLRTRPEAKISGEKFPEAGKALLNSSHTGVYAAIYYDQVLYTAREESGGASKPLLGCVMLHELGHLLGLVHSPAGIMRSHWRAADLAMISRGGLHFSPSECHELQTEIATSLKAKTARGVEMARVLSAER